MPAIAPVQGLGRMGSHLRPVVLVNRPHGAERLHASGSTGVLAGQGPPPIKKASMSYR